MKRLEHRGFDNPSDKDINQGTLVVFNLDPSVSNEDLRQIFGAYGEVKEVIRTYAVNKACLTGFLMDIFGAFSSVENMDLSTHPDKGFIGFKFVDLNNLRAQFNDGQSKWWKYRQLKHLEIWSFLVCSQLHYYLKWQQNRRDCSFMDFQRLRSQVVMVYHLPKAANILEKKFQVVTEGTRAHDILKQVPFLVPFTSRGKIFSWHRFNGVFTRNRFSIGRDHILEGSYNQMSALLEES
ncbi:hypothetical protein ACFE04_021267 [Oxalis oulophora]